MSELFRETIPQFLGGAAQLGGLVLQWLQQQRNREFFENPPGTTAEGQTPFSADLRGTTPSMWGDFSRTMPWAEHYTRAMETDQANVEKMRGVNTANQATVQGAYDPVLAKSREMMDVPAVTQGEVDMYVAKLRGDVNEAARQRSAEMTSQAGARGLSPDAIAAINQSIAASGAHQVGQGRLGAELRKEELNRAFADAALRNAAAVASGYAGAMEPYNMLGTQLAADPNAAARMAQLLTGISFAELGMDAEATQQLINAITGWGGGMMEMGLAERGARQTKQAQEAAQPGAFDYMLPIATSGLSLLPGLWSNPSQVPMPTYDLFSGPTVYGKTW